MSPPAPQSPVSLSRRRFLGTTVAAASAMGVWPGLLRAAQPESLPEVAQPEIPRWRGFNLLERFSVDWGPPQPFRELDFELTREWGFDFLRIPMDYRFWGSQKDYFEIREDALAEIDRVVDLGLNHGIHINLNFHRAPGYCVNDPKEPTVLWEDNAAMDACEKHWSHFAARYRDVPGDRVSFNLLNEPGERVSAEVYERFCRRMIAAILREDADRLIVVDGLRWGQRPVWGLWDEAVVQSGRGYGPFGLTHYKASWIQGSENWSVPTWPGDGWDVGRLEREYVEPWKAYRTHRGAVHIGEFGCFNRTPHPVALSWMRDLLALWKREGWGWALWNLRGGFGVADSDRDDVEYEDHRGMKLDRAMLELLREG